jgi:hypothetical protein
MLHTFAMFFKCFHVILKVFQTDVSSVSHVFKRTLQMLHLNVLKVDWSVAHVVM